MKNQFKEKTDQNPWTLTPDTFTAECRSRLTRKTSEGVYLLGTFQRSTVLIWTQVIIFASRGEQSKVPHILVAKKIDMTVSPSLSPAAAGPHITTSLRRPTQGSGRPLRPAAAVI